jgi:3-hydroxyisobutyrate dehydrogenase-like beta-hydroxyacid dehydrogenase
MSLRTRKNVGVIGLGIIGQRVAENLREHGFHVFVWNRTPRPVPNFVGSPAEVAELCDFIQIFVSDDEALLAMAQRITRDLTPNHVVMAHCTVSPDTMRAAAEIVEKRGARFLDAPFTGSKTAAENGQLVYYVGGDEVALRQARPILEASSKEIIEMGKVGDATTIKVATNMVTAASVQGAAEALALVYKSGLSVEKFAAAMRNNGSNSATLDMKLPMMMQGNFEPHFSVKHMLKDVVIATRLARGFAMEFGATDASRHGLVEEMRQGRGDDDYSSLLRQFLPAGRSLMGEPGTSNGEEEQPSLAGIDEGRVPEKSLEVAGAAIASAPAASTQTNTAPVVESVPAQATTLVESLPAHLETAQAVPAPTTNEAPFAPQSSSEARLADVPAVPAESTEQKSETEGAHGLWGGFWRRRTDD